MRTVQVRTHSSEHWVVVGRPTPTSVEVVLALANGKPSERSPRFEACGVCFAGDPTAADERQRRPGFCAPAVVMGRCSWCGFVHRQSDAQRYDAVTSDGKAAKAEREASVA
jgi:hypothetical protein